MAEGLCKVSIGLDKASREGLTGFDRVQDLGLTGCRRVGVRVWGIWIFWDVGGV